MVYSAIQRQNGILITYFLGGKQNKGIWELSIIYNLDFNLYLLPSSCHHIIQKSCKQHSFIYDQEHIKLFAFPQTSSSVTTSQTEVKQTVMASVTKVTTREKVMMKYTKDKMPSSPPQKKRQIVVDAELQKRYVNVISYITSNFLLLWNSSNFHHTYHLSVVLQL